MPERHHCPRHNLLHDGPECPRCDCRYGLHDVLSRMRLAHTAGRGVNISADELRSLSVTLIGQMWEEDDPRI